MNGQTFWDICQKIKECKILQKQPHLQTELIKDCSDTTFDKVNLAHEVKQCFPLKI